jgi:anaerobic selenocysteine-containing dehydrogenase
MLRLGPHGDGFRPWRSGLRLRDLLGDPRGVDLGPLRPSLVAWLEARDARIDLAHARMSAELDRLAGELAAPAREGLLLIGRRDLRTNNSWLHNAPLSAKGRDRCTLLMHPDDARERKLASDDRVRIRSRVGQVIARLEVSGEIMPGVVSLPHGWGHGSRPGMQLRVAEAHAHVSLNDLTDEQLLEPVVGNAILNGVPVEVEAAGA